MSDLKLFRISSGTAEELDGSAMELERRLQRLIEDNMETLFGVYFLESEYSTGLKHRGRIDSIGIDENGSPVIFEYKRSSQENVINQGLFYLDWLLDHQGEFKLLVMERRGAEVAAQINWSNPRLVCVAGDFKRYDEHAVQQINRSIELVRYRDFGGELLALELLTAVSAVGSADEPTRVQSTTTSGRVASERTVSEYLERAPSALRDLFDDLDARLLALGDDVQKIVRKNYFAYKRLKNFACVEVHPQTKVLLVYVKVNPDEVEQVPGFSRDVRSIGHFGTGDLELKIKDQEDLVRAESLITHSYDGS